MLKKENNLHKDILTTKLDQKPTRDGYGDGVVEAGEKYDDIVVLTGDLTESTRCQKFKERFPNRFIEVGVAEQNMAGIAAGMALSGKTPFVTSYATFNPGRNWDQIRVSICYSNANVKIIGAHAGLSVGPDGATHQALEDIAITRVLPNLIVLSPCDYEEARKATIAAAKQKGPIYLRLTREKTPTFTTEKTPFEIGKATTLMKGGDATIIGTGPVLYEALLAANELKENRNIACEVINVSTIKPLDKETILKAARKTGRVITIEEHQATGGLGSAVTELLAQENPVPMKILGMKDCFGESGTYQELLEKYGLNAHHIEIEVRNFLRETR